MRRHDREVRTTERLMSIMELCSICRVAMHDDGGEIYVIPLSFAYEKTEGDNLRLWFHAAEAGKKLDLLRQNDKVGFEMDCNVQLIESERPCSYSYTYMCLVGRGRVAILPDDDIENKCKAMELILLHQANRKGVVLKEEMLRYVTVFYIDVTELTGKEHV